MDEIRNITSSTLLMPPMYPYHSISDVHLSIFIVFALATVVISSLAKLVNIPFRIPAILCGIAIGIVGAKTTLLEVEQLDSSLMLSIFVPTFIAKLTYSNDNYLAIRTIPQVLIIVVVGNMFFLPTFAIMLGILGGNQMPVVFVCIIALLLAPNDCIKPPDLDAIKNLEILMRVEVILSLVLCLTMFTVLLGVSDGIIATWYQMVCVFLRYIVVGILVGYGFGWLASLSIRQHYNDSTNAICTVFSVIMFAYTFCEYVLYCSGSLATFIVLFQITEERARLLTKTDNDIGLIINIVYTFVELMCIVIYIAYAVHSYRNLDGIHFIEGIAIYIIGNILRLIMFLILSSILSRIGYGFDFTSLITIFWSVRKGPYQLMQIITLRQQRVQLFVDHDYLFAHCLVYIVLSHAINGTTLKLLLKRLGLFKLSNRKKSNVSHGINKINETRANMLTMLKLNRFYSDANWPVIHEQTALKNAYAEVGFLRDFAKEDVVCELCNTTIPLEPSKEEYNENFKQVQMRVLKAMRVSFLKQHENGFLSKLDTRILMQFVEVAMDASDMNLKLDKLFKCIYDKKPVIFMNAMKKILTISSSIKIPKSQFRKRCYSISTSLNFELIVHAATIILLAANICRISYTFSFAAYLSMVVLDTLGTLVFFVEFVLKLLACAHVTCVADLQLYFKNHWNKIDFLILLLCICGLVNQVLYLCDVINLNKTLFVTWIKLIIAVKLLKVINRTYPQIVSYIERKKDFRLMRAFKLALAIVISCQEVVLILPSLTDKTSIREVIKTRLLNRQSEIEQCLGALEKERPSLATTIKTAQALRTVLKFLRERIVDLHISGLIDNFEYQKLNTAFSGKHKYLESIKVLEMIQPQLIFNEIPWLGNDTLIKDFLYQNVKTKIFNANDVLCKPGGKPDGIYIIVAGYFQVTYHPSGEEIERLKYNGELPIKEHLEAMRFDGVHEDYMTIGNRMGELCFLTKRPYGCSIISQSPSQAFILTRDVLQHAMTLSPDPVTGLGAKLWKATLFFLGRRILLSTPAYQSIPREQVHHAMNRAVVPDISYYNVISLSQVVEDVLLLEGIVVDFSTREIFMAPCAIPRHVTKLIMPRSTLITVRNIIAKLMFFPNYDIDDYEMMQIIEKNSELMPDHKGAMLTRKRVGSSKMTHSHASRVFGLRKQTLGPSLYSTNQGSFLDSKISKLTGSRPTIGRAK